MPLPTRRIDPYADIDTSNFSTAHTMDNSQLLLMAEIAESRGQFDLAGTWKSIAMDGAMDAAEVANRAQFEGTPLVEQAPAPAVPASPTTFDRREPASREIELPPVPPEPSTGDAREFVNDGHRSHPDAGIAAQARRNEQLLAAQERSMR